MTVSTVSIFIGCPRIPLDNIASIVNDEHRIIDSLQTVYTLFCLHQCIPARKQNTVNYPISVNVDPNVKSK